MSSDGRYDRQINFAGLGVAGQKKLRAGKALIVGVGGLGSAVADILARSGVGLLRLVDDDRVSLDNLHRQILFDETDAAENAPKAHAAARRIGRVNRDVTVEPIQARFEPANAIKLADGMDVLIDGSDNFATRFLINDLCVHTLRPWVFGGVVGAEGQVAAFVPGRTACLRCIFPSPPPPCCEPTCRIAGVLPPAVVAIAALQAMEALKILSGRAETLAPGLLKLDLWTNALQRIDLGCSPDRPGCPCCGQGDFEFLFPNAESSPKGRR